MEPGEKDITEVHGRHVQICTKCGVGKTESEFYRRADTGKLRLDCKLCNNAASKVYRTLHADRISESRKERNREYRQRNFEKRKLYNKQWREENRDRDLATKTRYRKQHMSSYREACAGYRARKLDATPGWANHVKIRRVYTQAEYRRLMTGEDYHVDHIIPLRGKDVCGLHVDYNLQILPASENRSKGNRRTAKSSPNLRIY